MTGFSGGYMMILSFFAEPDKEFFTFAADCLCVIPSAKRIFLSDIPPPPFRRYGVRLLVRRMRNGLLLCGGPGYVIRMLLTRASAGCIFVSLNKGVHLGAGALGWAPFFYATGVQEVRRMRVRRVRRVVGIHLRDPAALGEEGGNRSQIEK